MQLVSVLQRENLGFMNNDNHRREVKKCLELSSYQGPGALFMHIVDLHIYFWRQVREFCYCPFTDKELEAQRNHALVKP